MASRSSIPAKSVPLLFDTDIGSDIDDAVALAYLLAQPRCELLGVTTVTGDTRQRAALARYVCLAAGHPEVPILAGLSAPIGNGPGQPDVHQFAAIRSRPPEGDYGSPDGTDALRFLNDSIRKRPGEVTLLTVGPLTNIAALFRRWPDLPSLIGRVVSMIGFFGVRRSGRGEWSTADIYWNSYCDPLAAQIFFGAMPAGKLACVGVDVTLACVLPARESIQRFARGGPALRAVSELAEVWFQGENGMIFHDPLAAAVVFRPELCEWKRGSVQVQPDGTEDAGATIWTPSSDGPVEVAKTVDVEGFFREYFETACVAQGQGASSQ